jgi:hypothetical protein
MRSLKHVGRVKNTGRRCVVVFRELYNDQGKVIDEHNCLIIESETLPDAEHQDIMQIVESDTMQEASNAFEVFARSRLGNGQTSLAWMHSTGRLRKMPTNNVELTPNTTQVISLDQLNTIVRMQNAGASQADIENVLQDDTDPTARDAKLTESTPATNQNTPSQASSDGVLSDAEIAQVRLNQAVEFEAQAKELRDQAYNLDPSLKPRRGRPAKKAAAKTKA